MAPAKRKHKSGAQKRRAKYEAAEAAARAAMTPAAVVASGNLEELERANYAESGPPPADVVGRMVWVQGLMAKVIYWTGRHAGESVQTTRRTILEGGAKLGMTAVKALYEERLKKLEVKVYGKRRQKGKDDASEDGLEELPPD